MESLKKTLESLLRQEEPAVEIIVVDDGSTDGTHEFLSQAALQQKIVYIHSENQGPAAARNLGIQSAKASYIAFTDDDCVVPPNWLSCYRAAFENHTIDFAGGSVHNQLHENIFAEASQDITNHFVEYFGKGGSSTGFLTSNNICYRTQILKEHGGFDERFRRAGGEERALNLRVLSNGGASRYLPQCTIHHYHNLTLSRFFRQQMNYGRGGFVLYNIVGKEQSPPFQPMPFDVYMSMVNSLFSHGSFADRFLKFVLFATGQVAAIIGYFLEQSRWRSHQYRAS